jgi:hypothetical protein
MQDGVLLHHLVEEGVVPSGEEQDGRVGAVQGIFEGVVLPERIADVGVHQPVMRPRRRSVEDVVCGIGHVQFVHGRAQPL